MLSRRQLNGWKFNLDGHQHLSSLQCLVVDSSMANVGASSSTLDDCLVSPCVDCGSNFKSVKKFIRKKQLLELHNKRQATSGFFFFSFVVVVVIFCHTSTACCIKYCPPLERIMPGT